MPFAQFMNQVTNYLLGINGLVKTKKSSATSGD